MLSTEKVTIQFITRWTFVDIESVAESFDFTVCQAVLGRAGVARSDPWVSHIGENYYSDLAARRLVYTHPIREEEAGGSMLRVIKYVKRGYTIQVDSLGGVISRLIASVNGARVDMTNEKDVAFILNGLLQEVDPSIAVDGLDANDQDPEVAA